MMENPYWYLDFALCFFIIIFSIPLAILTIISIINNITENINERKKKNIETEILISSDNLEEIKSFLFHNYYNVDDKTITKLVLRIKELQADNIINERYK